MADPRTFVLIGNFTDNITPALVKINKSLEQVKANLESVTKATKPLNDQFKVLSDSSNKFSSSLKTQASDIRDITAAMRSMRNEMGRVNRAYRAAGRNRNIVPPPPPPPRPPRSALPPPPPPPPRTPRTSQYSPTPGQPRQRRVREERESYAAAAGGFVAGSQLADLITGAIVKGFNLGVAIMVRPFQYAANAFGERIRDEISDIQSAGGLFATDRRYQLNMFKDFGEARRTQEMINARLAKSAAELPGETAQYVREAKRITDTMIGAMGRSQQAFVKYAETLGAKQGDKTDALATVIQKFTEKAVLLGQQPGGGGGRTMYGIPQLLEMMVNMPQVNLKSMSYRYAALRDNPLLANALQQGEAEINKTAVGTAERLKAIMKILDEALPNEVVSAMRNSMDGIIQTIKSAIIDPETGIFGLGRKMEGVLVPRVDSLGRYLDKAGNVVKDISKAEMETASLYSLLRDSIAGFIVPLQGLINILPQVYDPLRAIGLDLVEFRNISQRFLATFNGFTKGFEQLGDKLKSYNIKSTAAARGGLLTIANLLQNLGKINTGEFQKYSKMLQDPKADLGNIAKSLFSELFDSKFMKMIGEVVGKIVGGTLKMVGDLMAGVTDMANAGPFAEGLKKGWDAAKGSEGISKIFKSLFKIIGEAILTAFKAAPFEMSLLTALTVGMPLISGAITGGITALFELLFRNPKALLQGAMNIMQKAMNALLKVKPVNVKDVTNRITDPRRLLPAAKQTKALPTSALAATDDVAKSAWFTKMVGNLKNFGKMLIAPIKAFGKFNVALAALTGVIELVTALMSGEDFAGALGKAAGPVVGSIIGGAIAGPVGAIIGGMIGSLKPITDFFSEVFRSVGGALQGLGDSLVMIGVLTGDVFGELFGGLGDLITIFSGTKTELDGIRIILAPITLALQALEVGLKGFALLLAEMRVFFKRYFGSSEEYQAAIKERDRLNASMKESQGRINAYNDSMLGTVTLQKRVNDAQYELVNGGKKLSEARKKELVAYIESAKRLNKEIEIKKEVTVKTAAEREKAPGGPTTPRANVWDQYSKWWTTNANNFLEGIRKLPENLAWIAGYMWQKTTEVWQGIQKAFTQFGNWFVSLPGKLQAAVNRAITTLESGWKKFTSWLSELPNKFTSQVSATTTALNNGTQQIVNAIVNWAKSLPGQIVSSFGKGQQAAKTPVGTRWDPEAKKTVIVYSDGSTSAAAQAFGSGNAFTGTLSKAISFEQKNKPPGSDLVIANSSETVIPAAGGHGMMDFVETLRAGFNAMIATYKAAQQKQDSTLNAIKNTLVSNQAQTNARLQKLETKFTTPGMAGGLGGASAGGVDAFTPIAQRYGLQMTSGYRPGDPGWHGANRARDYSNGTGPTKQMLDFAQYLAATHGQKLKELIYTPLGFSIKNGQKVAPYAQGSHYNHVHVAYALGPNQGKMFTSLSAARSWEESMVPGSVKVASITGNSKEGFGGDTHVVNNFTITQQPGEDGEALANRVATLFFDAMNNAQSSSIFT